MAWSIPLARVAGALAVSFTGADDRGREGVTVEPPIVQRPRPPVLPPDTPTAVDPAPAEPSPAEPSPAEPSEVVPAPEPARAPDPGAVPEPTPDVTAPTPAPDIATDAPPMEAPLGELPEPGPEPAPARRGRALLRPTENRSFFSIGVGGATGTSPYSAYLGGGMDFQWEMAIGGHSRKRPTFGGAFVVQQRKGFINELSFAGRFQWDKPFSEAFALYSSVNLDLGINVPIGYGPYLGFAGLPSAMIGAGWSVKAILAERFMIFARPVNPNLVAPSFYSFPLYVAIRWDVMAGLGTVW